MASVKATCSCGASFETNGSNIYCGLELSKFLDAHKLCREKCEPEDSADLLPCGHSREYIIYGSKRVYCSVCDKSI